MIINPILTKNGYIVENLRIAECETGIALRSGAGYVFINNNWVKNTWVGALVREDCPDCYT